MTGTQGRHPYKRGGVDDKGDAHTMFVLQYNLYMDVNFRVSLFGWA